MRKAAFEIGAKALLRSADGVGAGERSLTELLTDLQRIPSNGIESFKFSAH